MSIGSKPRKPTHTHTHTHTDSFYKIKKQIGTICFTSILSILTIPAYSTTPDLPSGALCNEDNLNTDTGPVDIEVTWEPNTINTTWYSEGTQVSGPASCTYNAVMTLPSNRPTREGYTFAGWTLRAPQCTVPSADISTNGTNGYGHGWYDDADYCKDCNNGSCGPINCSTVSDLSLHQWKVPWSNGDVVKGIASCQPTLPSDVAYATTNVPYVVSGQMDVNDFIAEYTTLAGQEKGTLMQQAFQAYANNVNDGLAIFYGQLLSLPSNSNFTTNSTGSYCVCKATHYTANNSQQCQLASSLPWIPPYFNSVNSGCLIHCAASCALSVSMFSGYRSALFGVTQ